MGQRKKLIFVSSADPRTDPEPIRRAYLWATTAAKEGLEAEVRLVGEAVRAAHPGEIKDFERIGALREGILAGASGDFLVSLWPGCADAREVSDEDVTSIGGVRRPLGDVLRELAEGTSVVVPFDWAGLFGRKTEARREARGIFDSLGDRAGVAASLHYLAVSAAARGDYDGAMTVYQRCVDEWRESGVERAYGTALNFVLHNLGVIALQTGQVATARSRLEEALVLARSLGEEGGVAVHLHVLGEIDEVLGSFDAASRHYRESLRLARALGFDRSVSASLTALARAALRVGDVHGAARSAVEALDVAVRDADHLRLLPAMVAVASVAAVRGDVLRAARLLGAVAACQAARGRDVSVVERTAYEEADARCRAAVGDQAYEAAVLEGSQWSAMQAADIARAVAVEVAAVVQER